MNNSKYFTNTAKCILTLFLSILSLTIESTAKANTVNPLNYIKSPKLEYVVIPRKNINKKFDKFDFIYDLKKSNPLQYSIYILYQLKQKEYISKNNHDHYIQTNSKNNNQLMLQEIHEAAVSELLGNRIQFIYSDYISINDLLKHITYFKDIEDIKTLYASNNIFIDFLPKEAENIYYAKELKSLNKIISNFQIRIINEILYSKYNLTNESYDNLMQYFPDKANKFLDRITDLTKLFKELSKDKSRKNKNELYNILKEISKEAEKF
ncbi:hypothetical protein [Fluviispira multicolorata]|uniref:Uncharacterized protein n=1 Tax=Fluviispira multicolorata TaxID=2654512 RepID=A0A833JCZ2_9BACT|nr:hypothetical protein [Fluviispira multicolorata]KAB8031001.1 hypothetical protein GCL57_08520 [Fluviispira multicolorata]